MTDDPLGTDIIKCTNCNASMRYSIDDGALKCEHCGHIDAIEGENNVMRRELTDDAMREHVPWKENVVFRCSLCNAHIDVDKREIMKMCPFCGNPNVIKTEELPGIKPDSLIPYTVTKESAVELFRKWIHSKIFAPGECRKRATAENVNSVYSPVWSFTAQTRNLYNGTLGKDYTVTVTDAQGRTRTETRTRWFRVSGAMEANYKDVFIPSGELIPKDMAQKLEPYPMDKSTGYRQEYLAGKAAEHYSRDLSTCFSDFGKYVYADLCQRIRRKYNADRVGSMNIDTTYITKYFNYVLIPNYIANFGYKKKRFNFYVNGATGKIAGRYPKSIPKIAAVVAAVGAVIGGIVYFLM
jgi:predicted RNA-binding Zn-ribbon protein involved in translation (DUF1610 family)